MKMWILIISLIITSNRLGNVVANIEVKLHNEKQINVFDLTQFVEQLEESEYLCPDDNDFNFDGLGQVDIISAGWMQNEKLLFTSYNCAIPGLKTLSPILLDLPPPRS